MLSEPLRKLDCCLITDGGGAVVLTRADRARDAAKRPIRVLGAAERHGVFHVGQADLSSTPGRESARDALGQAGIRPEDVNVFEPYDNFTSSVLIALEELGICGAGESGPFVEAGGTLPGGRLPTSTMGGGLSYCHPGALGMLLLVEAVRQLRGEAGARQVPNARVAVAHGLGGPAFSTGATVVLGRE